MIRKETNSLRKRLKDLNTQVRDVQKTIEVIQKAKEDKVKEIDSFVEAMHSKLGNDLK